MFKTKRQFILMGCIFLIIIGIILIYNTKKEIPLVIPYEENYVEEKVESKPALSVKDNLKVKLIESDIKGIKIGLEVSGKNYKTSINIGSSVFEAMEAIKKESTTMDTFDFKYKETPGLGNFITEINGIKGSPGKYWIYYVNNEKATVGASKFILKEGDIIRWNQEGL